jgi:hypothetical protein
MQATGPLAGAAALRGSASTNDVLRGSRARGGGAEASGARDGAYAGRPLRLSRRALVGAALRMRCGRRVRRRRCPPAGAWSCPERSDATQAPGDIERDIHEVARIFQAKRLLAELDSWMAGTHPLHAAHTVPCGHPRILRPSGLPAAPDSAHSEPHKPAIPKRGAEHRSCPGGHPAASGLRWITAAPRPERDSSLLGTLSAASLRVDLTTGQR